MILLGMILIYLRIASKIKTGTGPRHDEQNRTGNQKKKAYNLRPIFAIPLRLSIQHTLCAKANIYNHWRQRKSEKREINGDSVLMVVRVTHNIIPAVQRPQMPANNNRNKLQTQKNIAAEKEKEANAWRAHLMLEVTD